MNDDTCAVCGDAATVRLDLIVIRRPDATTPAEISYPGPLACDDHVNALYRECLAPRHGGNGCDRVYLTRL